jgi:hypothetical protein
MILKGVNLQHDKAVLLEESMPSRRPWWESKSL